MAVYTVKFTPSSPTMDAGWGQQGTWTTGSSGNSSTPPTTVSVVPNNGNSLTQTISFAFSDVNGGGAITSTQIDINSTLVVSNACYIYFVRGTNAIYLANDAGTFQGPLTLGAAGTLQNSQCSLNSATSSVAISGNNLTLSVALTFKAAFAGTRNIYLEAKAGILDSGWVNRGIWIVP